MNFIKIQRLAFKTLTSGVLAALILTGTMVTLATTNKPVGELLVTGNKSTEIESVTVNGEPATSGRTIFSASTITTSENLGATINLGKAGKLELGPNTSFTLNATSTGVSGDLSSGMVTVLNSAEGVDVKTLSGTIVKVNAGESVDAEASSTASAQASKKVVIPIFGAVSLAALIAIIAVGATIATIVIVNATNDDDNRVISPVR